MSWKRNPNEPRTPRPGHTYRANKPSKAKGRGARRRAAKRAPY